MLDVIELTKQLIKYNSVTPVDAGCQGFLKQKLSALGFSIVDIPCENASNFWASKGQQGPMLVFAGHTDVVAPGPSELWKSDPFTPVIENGMLYGRGAADMKGSLAAMLVACERFFQNPNHSINGSVGFLITSAEEGPSDLGTPKVLDYLQQNNIKIDYCIVGEPTSDKKVGDTVKNGRRGSLSGELTVMGKQGHIAYPHLAINPIHQSLKALDAFINTSWDKGNAYFPATSLQISNLHAGVGAGNVIPPILKASFNFRYSPEVTVEQLKAKTKAIFDQFQLSYEINWTHYGIPYLTQQGRLLEATQQAIVDLYGYPPKLSTTGGTSDGRYIANYCSEVIELGPCNQSIHQANEYVTVKDLDMLVQLYEKILCRILIA